jgi:hypothetical protein
MSEPNSETQMRDNVRGLTAARAISAPISGSSAGCRTTPNGDPANLAGIAAISNSQNGATGKPRSRRRVMYAVWPQSL